MLHTDAFNKSNKRKMTKAAYVKNTRLPGVQPEVLDVCMNDQLSKPQLITVHSTFSIILSSLPSSSLKILWMSTVNGVLVQSLPTHPQAFFLRLRKSTH